MIKPKLIKFFLLIVMLISSSQFAAAHLAGGDDITVDGYVVDFGYDPAEPSDADRTIIAINLLNATTNELIVPDSVWVRISNPEDITFAGTFFPESQHVSFTYKFPHGGDYDILIRFNQDNEVFLETDFTLTVEAAKNKLSQEFFLLAGLAIIFAIAVSNIIMYRFYPKLMKKR